MVELGWDGLVWVGWVGLEPEEAGLVGDVETRVEPQAGAQALLIS